MTRLPPTAALVLIDMQYAIDAPYWTKDGPRNNPDAEATAARLVDAWRRTHRPLIHVKHNSREPQSAFRPGQKGNDFKEATRPQPGETIVAKHTPCAFIDTGLEAQLRAADCNTVVICGVSTHNSVEATARVAGCLGFNTIVVDDACFTFARRVGGKLYGAEETHALALANLEGEYAEIATADAVLQSL